MASFWYDDMTDGLLDDVRVRFTNVRFLLHEFVPGEGAKPCFGFDPVAVEDGDNVLRIQLYTCGAADNWAPSDDGMDMVYIGPGDPKEMSKVSGFGFFMKNVGLAGFPRSLVKPKDISFFEGVEAKLMQLPTGNTRKDGSEATKAVPVEFYLKSAGEQKTTKGKAKGKGKTTLATGTPSDSSPNGTEGNVAEGLGELITAAVAAADEGIPRAQLSTLIKGQKEQDFAWKKEAMKLTIEEDTFKAFLANIDLQLVGGVIDVNVGS